MDQDAEISQQTDSVEGAMDDASASHIELDSAEAADVEVDARVSESERSEKDVEEDDISEPKPRLSPEITEDVSDDQSSELGSEADEKMSEVDLKPASDYKALLSEFDDYVASDKMASGVSRALSYGFEVGDLVWGKVKSHPWWPGHIFNEAFASPSVRRMRRLDHVLVAFFGDSSYGWFDPAELIPFEPHLPEKSQQTVSKHFVRAVEEAVDEASRRSALGLTCKCRNPFNFRPADVEDYFAVDVPDYELQAVYSSDQIKKSRDRFSPLDTISFVKQLALAPQDCDSESLKFLKKRAVVYAFRKAVFEEFDETYAQAFGTRSVRTSTSAHEPQNRAPPRAPLSGPLVIAETLGSPKSSKKPTKVKESKKKDKYLLKRRDEAGANSIQSGHVEASSAASHFQGLGESSEGELVPPREAPTLETPMKNEQSEIVSMDLSVASPGKESFVSKRSLDEEKGLAEESKEKIDEKSAILREHDNSEAMASPKKEAGTDPGAAESSLQPLHEPAQVSHTSASEGKGSTGPVIKKVKIAKRSSSEMSSENPPSEPKKKKKKKKEPNSDHQGNRKLLSSEEAGAKKLSQLGSSHVHSSKEVDVPQLLSHLQDLSLDPFHGLSVPSFGAARKFFLHFRSLNYQKSLAVSPSDATAESSKETKPSKLVKNVNRIEDPSKAGKKRLSSDRQDEIPSAKKLKKANQLKSMTSEKKIIREAKDSMKPVREHSGAVQAKPTKSQTGKKTAPSVKVVEPTMLVMKFPSGTSLPSAALLKARFGRFGLLDQAAIRVFWKSSTCRVVFLYKADAQTAFRYAAGNKSLFGNVNVRYFLRDVDAPKGDPHEPENAKEDDEPQNQRQDQAPLHQPILPPPNINLKSCLKKPADDSTSSSNNGNGNRGTARVKFMLGGEESSRKAAAEPPFSTTLCRNNGPSSSSSSSIAMEYVSSKKFQNIVHQLPPSTLPPILPLPPQYSKSQLPVKLVEHIEPPMPPNRNFRGPSPVVGAGDISHQMLNLLSKCNEVVSNVTGLLGYVPYHPL